MFALGAALLVATALVIALGLQVRQLRAEQRWLVERASQAYAGMYVPRVAATALDGSRHHLGQPRARSQVLFFFTTTCPYCRASLPLVGSIARQLEAASGGTAQMLGVALDDPAAAAAYAREHALPFPVVALRDRRTAMLFRARKVPLLLVVGADGRVRYARPGVLNSREGVTGVLTAVRGTEVPDARPNEKETRL
ncbi:peroxiredoxin family protein [Vulcaniibacterium tengchongense]|uniref:Peroxiredoxin n=1 Tax=Vulcaniibacterium tengchongense TaxID=1273429 RepID=A0A3N4V3R2_9GAMM|nr:TlpA disulfide reductase family protein [Vulcaniibacterium tengchongense]RPE77128.1 peroxiredoxin [Vulcaniibacterium tengchongense]